jgi:class 3 adenylate cyclase/tetratricopeptide (TPR) repeat protein
MSQTRRLSAILAADVAGYSRLMGADEEGTLERLKALHRELLDPKIAEHGGRIVKTTGDGLLVEFARVVNAVRRAAEMQRAMVDRDVNLSEDRRIKLRIGINLGDIIAVDDDIFGDGVNVAARPEALAEPGGICISRVVRDQIRDKLDYAFVDVGERSVKNIARPARVCGMTAAAVVALSPAENQARVGKPTSSTTPQLSIVVLPFANLSNDPEQENFVDGITEDLTTDLSRIADSFVISRNTAFTYKGKPLKCEANRPRAWGSVRARRQCPPNRRSRPGECAVDRCWNRRLSLGGRFDIGRADLDQAQDEITGRLAQSLNLELVEAVGRRIEQETAVDPDARDLIMRGWAWYYRPMSAGTAQEAQRAFEQALAIDPRSIDARIGIASILVRTVAEGWSSTRDADQGVAQQLLLDVLERDTNRPSAHYAFRMLPRVQNRLDEAVVEFDTTIALDCNHARAFFRLGQTLMFLGRPEEGIPHIEKAIRLNPRDPNIARPYGIFGTANVLVGRVDQGIVLLRQACSADRQMYWLYLTLAGALGYKGDVDGAKNALAEALRLKPEVDSLTRYCAVMPWMTYPQHWALREKTLNLGLRRAGFPED